MSSSLLDKSGAINIHKTLFFPCPVTLTGHRDSIFEWLNETSY